MKLLPLLSALLLRAVALGATTPTLTVPVEPAIVTTPLHGGVFLLVGRGGNIAVFPSADGTVMVDDQYAPRSKLIQEAVAQITPQAVQLVINTHFHFDHTGGNDPLGAAGVKFLAQDNVRKRLVTGERFPVFNNLEQPPTSAAGLPSTTFARQVTLHRGRETIDIVHPGYGAHTDGDAIVFFRQANVVHTGDIFVRYGLPFIDTMHGGSLEGMIAACEYIHGQVRDDTQIIPGHGAVATRADLAKYIADLKKARDGLEQARLAHPGVDAIVAADPLKGVDLKEANLPVEVWIRLALEGRANAPK